jgi:NAD(P)-dependent dehydrogenase (short-subunit alcohol dehydrogenase family)
MISLEGKVAVIPGASRGVGAAVARQCDVRHPVKVDALVAATAERFGRLDILLANAGVGATVPSSSSRPSTSRR